VLQGFAAPVVGNRGAEPCRWQTLANFSHLSIDMDMDMDMDMNMDTNNFQKQQSVGCYRVSGTYQMNSATNLEQKLVTL
jgi:hypothetical protein